MDTTPIIEYGVMNTADSDGYLHRGPWSKDRCDDWVARGLEDGVPAGMFVVVTRTTTPWTPVAEA